MPARSTCAYAGRPARMPITIRMPPLTCDNLIFTRRLLFVVSVPIYGYQVAEHGDGSHLAPFGSFLKCSAVSHGICRNSGSSTVLVIVIHVSAFGVLIRSQYSVSTALPL